MVDEFLAGATYCGICIQTTLMQVKKQTHFSQIFFRPAAGPVFPARTQAVLRVFAWVKGKTNRSVPCEM
jgi:hypothetical protein